jgi:hypothetical protein
MSVVVLTRPDGRQVAVNTAHWHTITEEIGGPTGAHTQIGFSGLGPLAASHILRLDIVQAENHGFRFE